MKLFKYFLHPIFILVIFCMFAYYPFFLQGKVPFPGDVLVGAYYPWLDYKWGYPAGVPVKNSLLSDSFSQFLPWKYMGVEMITNGIWPLWNNYAYSGYPLLANYASSPFQPFNILLLLPKYWGWGVYVWGQNVVAALGLYFYLRTFIKNPWAKVGGSLVFAFSGLMSTWAEFGTGVYAAAMIPWILGSLEHYWQTRKTRYLFLLSAAFVTLFLSGHAQLTTYSSVLLFVYLGWHWVKNKGDRGNKGGVVLPVVFWGASVLIALVQLLPVLENTATSIRSAEAFSKSINYGLNGFHELFRLVAADFFGNPATNNYWDTVFYAEQSSFLGTLTLPLMVPFVLKRFRNAVISFWGIVFLVTLFLAIDTPITQWFYSLPLPLLTYSNSSRIFFVLSLATGILTAFSLSLLEQKDFTKWILRGLIWLMAVFIGVFVGVGIIKFLVRTYATSPDVVPVLNNLKVTLKNLVLPVGMVLGGMGLLGIFGRLGKKSHLIVFGIVILLVFDLSRYFLKLNPFVSQQFVFPSTPVTNYLQTQNGLYRISRADKEAMPPNTWMPYKFQFVEGYDPLVSEDYVRFFKVLNSEGYNSGIDRFSELTNYPSPFLDAMNVKYFIAVKRSAQDEIGKGDKLNYKIQETNYEKIFEDGATAVLENPNAKERAFFVPEVISFSDKTSLVQKLQDKQFDPTKQALLIDTASSQQNLSVGQVTVTSYTPNEILMNTNSAGKGFVVMGDSFDKGWSLVIDGQKQQLYQVDAAIRGFWVDSGTHQIKMYYWPDSLALGLKLSIVGIVGLLGLLGVSLWKRRL